MKKKRYVTVVDDTNDRLHLMEVDKNATEEEILQKYRKESVEQDPGYDPYAARLGVFEGTIIDYINTEE